MSVLRNGALYPSRVRAPVDDALAFHRALPGYEPTPLHLLDGFLLKDESARLGLPAFKILGASWAIERALLAEPDVHTLVAASAGNHGRAVAHEAARRGLAARIVLPARAVRARVEAIAAEGADVVVIDGTYEEAVARAAAHGAEPGVLEVADVGASGPAEWVIDGYATLFAEAAEQGRFDVVLVPIGVGSLGAAAARFGAAAGIPVVGVEAETAQCLTASLAAGRLIEVPTPGTSMAGLDCAEVSAAAWPDLLCGITATVTVTDAEAQDAMHELATHGLAIGHCGAAPLAALRQVADEFGTRPLLIATEGHTA